MIETITIIFKRYNTEEFESIRQGTFEEAKITAEVLFNNPQIEKMLIKRTETVAKGCCMISKKDFYYDITGQEVTYYG